MWSIGVRQRILSREQTFCNAYGNTARNVPYKSVEMTAAISSCKCRPQRLQQLPLLYDEEENLLPAE